MSDLESKLRELFHDADFPEVSGNYLAVNPKTGEVEVGQIDYENEQVTLVEITMTGHAITTPSRVLTMEAAKEGLLWLNTHDHVRAIRSYIKSYVGVGEEWFQFSKDKTGLTRYLNSMRFKAKVYTPSMKVLELKLLQVTSGQKAVTSTQESLREFYEKVNGDNWYGGGFNINKVNSVSDISGDGAFPIEVILNMLPEGVHEIEYVVCDATCNVTSSFVNVHLAVNGEEIHQENFVYKDLIGHDWSK